MYGILYRAGNEMKVLLPRAAGGDWRTHIDDADSFQQKKIAQKVNNKPGNDEEIGSRRAALQ